MKTLAVLTSALVCACASAPPAAPRTVVLHSPEQPAPSAAPAAPAAPVESNVAISADIKKACGLSDSEAFFSYNSATIRQQDRVILSKIAECFTSGPLKGQTMKLVGCTDPRGDEDYNYLLGQRRADSVRSAVIQAGLSESSVSSTSRGENEASGTDEPTWAKDRRVDMML
jgi:peptidoglycan-associated lipoprotein